MNSTTFIFCAFLSFPCLSLDLGSIQTDGLFDKNRDGVTDVAYEYFEDGTYAELVDSNYDGELDTRCLYDANDTLTECFYDQDFDKNFETTVQYEFGVPVKEGVDTNNNKSYEIILYYQSGVLLKGVRYYTIRSGLKRIGEVKFHFGYPLSEELTQTELSEREFSKLYWLME